MEKRTAANPVRQPFHRSVAKLLSAGQRRRARALLQSHLRKHRDDVLALMMLGRVHLGAGEFGPSERLLRRAVGLAPEHSAARLALADCLVRAKEPAKALAELDRLSPKLARTTEARSHRAGALSLLGRFDEEVAILEELIRKNPRRPIYALRLGHALRTLGRTEEAIAAYRRVLDASARDGTAWWSLANLKTAKFGDEDIAAMERSLDLAGNRVDNRINLSFALGKAYEDRGEAKKAFSHYDEGNRLRASIVKHDPAKMHSWVERCENTFTADFFAEREGWGCQSPDPIFIIGMQRSGSTLVEQILASHSAIEGTAELNELIAIGRELAEKARARGITFDEQLARMSAAEIRAIGESYVEQTRVYRVEGKPFFTDKMPNNWIYAALIRVALPNARIIDVRRHPLACGFSNWKQLYAKGCNHSYSLETMGLHYADYVRLMRHMDAVQPGAVHRVIYESLLDDFHGELRRLLDYLGLSFEKACLSFHSTDRAVRTISAEQVRQPINRKGVDQWRPYERWLDPLKMALGDVLEDWAN